MNKLYEAIANYLNNSNIPPSLVLKVETGDRDILREVIDAGFRHEGEFWIINQEDARKALMAHLGIQPPFDWNKHWRQERGRDFGK